MNTPDRVLPVCHNSGRCPWFAHKGCWLGAGARVYPLRLGGGNSPPRHAPRLYAHAAAFALASDHVLTNVQLKHVAQRAFKKDSVDYWLHHASERIDWDAADPEERC